MDFTSSPQALNFSSKMGINWRILAAVVLLDNIKHHAPSSKGPLLTKGRSGTGINASMARNLAEDSFCRDINCARLGLFSLA